MKEAAQLLAMAVWKRATREATQTFSREREQVKADQAGEKEDREHLLGMIETLQAENAMLRVKGAAADQDGERLQARLAKVENQLDRFQGRGVLGPRHAGDQRILTDKGALTPAEILLELRTWTIRGAALHKEPLTPGVLTKKMDVRVTHGKYFAAAGRSLLQQGRLTPRPAPVAGPMASLGRS